MISMLQIHDMYILALQYVYSKNSIQKQIMPTIRTDAK